MSRPIVVTLSPEERRALAERASANDRDIHQEARHVVRTAIKGAADFAQQPPAHRREDTHVG